MSDFAVLLSIVIVIVLAVLLVSAGNGASDNASDNASDTFLDDEVDGLVLANSADDPLSPDYVDPEIGFLDWLDERERQHHEEEHCRGCLEERYQHLLRHGYRIQAYRPARRDSGDLEW